MVGSLITRNFSRVAAGGILNGGALTVVESTISGNTSLAGGGISNSGTVTLRNTTVSGNRAADLSGDGIAPGGGLYNSGAMTLSNVTVTDNEASSSISTGAGGGIHTTTRFSNGAVVTLRNTIVAGNRADNDGADCSGTLLSQGYNLIQTLDGCTVAGVTTGNLLNVDAHLAPLADNGGLTPTHALLVDSPARDGGSPATPGSEPSACEATDQREVLRPQDGDADGTARCDIGAFEVQGAVGCPPGAGAIAAYRYTVTRGTRTLSLPDLTGRIEAGDQITAVVTIAPGCTEVTVALASYQAQAPTFDPQREQVLYGQDTRVAGTGEQRLTVAVPECYFQVDLVIGPVLERIGPPSDYYRQRQRDYATGGSRACPAFAAPPSPMPLPKAEVGMDTHKTYLGGVAR